MILELLMPLTVGCHESLWPLWSFADMLRVCGRLSFSELDGLAPEFG